MTRIKNISLQREEAWGAGDMKKLAECILDATKKEELIVVCGNNQKTMSRLKKAFGNEKRIKILGYTTQMTLYMKACDVLFTKPGGLTSTEGAVAGIPMVHTAPIPGCETANRKFFRKAGMSISARTMKGQAEAGIRLLYDNEAAEKMRERQRKYINADAAEDIYGFIHEKIKEKEVAGK